MRAELLTWYRKHARRLPWRQNRDPYPVWVSEIMLQQTQVATVIPFFERWLERFPTVEALAQADEADVLRHWEGLGYYRRARLMQTAARRIVEEGWPTTHREWVDLPGVGRYTAGALASITRDEPVPVVDGNVIRVFARLTGNRSVGSAREKAAWAWAESVLVREVPGEWNQALMELGATVCRPIQPECPGCPVQSFCVAHREGTVGELPVPEPRREVVRLDRRVVIPVSGDHVGLVPIPEGEWWSGMFRFPDDVGDEGDRFPLESLVHTVTHHRIRLAADLLWVERRRPEWLWVPTSEADYRALPTPYRKLWRQARSQLGAGLRAPS